MSGNFMIDSRIGFGKREAVPGVAELLAAVDFNTRLRALSIADIAVEMDNESSKFVTGDHSHDEAIPGMEPIGINFAWRMAQLEAEGPTPFTNENFPMTPHIEACGNSVTFDDVSGSYMIAPGVAQDNNTETFGVWDKNTKTGNGTQYICAGAMGNLKISTEGTKKPFVLSVELKGKVSDISDVPKAEMDVLVLQQSAMIDTIAVTNSNTVVKVTKLDNKGAIAAPLEEHEFCVSTIDFDMANVIEALECGADDSGIEHDARFQYAPTIGINPMLEELADFNWRDSLTNVDFYKFEVTKYVDSSKTDKAFELILPNTQLFQAAPTEDGNKIRNALNFRALRNKAGATQADQEKEFTLQIWCEDIA